jgi:unsaturated rhamnogalacturonyl hydrolase
MAEYAAAYGEVALYDDIANQVAQIDQRLHSNSGLLVRAWDSAKQQKWANPNTGAATIVWSKALGAYASALADVIELLPATHPQRAAVVASFTRLASAIVKAQDPASGLWWQVTDAPKRDKNYLEAAGSSEFVFALGKAARNGWIDAVKFHAPIDRGFRGAVDVFAALDKQGRLEVKQGSPNIDVAPVLTPDASYVAYVVPSQSNDPDAIAAFTRAAIEAVAMPR